MHSPIKRNVLQHKINTWKTKTRFIRLLRHPAWKWRSGSILISCFTDLSLTCLLRYLLTYSSGTHTGQVLLRLCVLIQ